MHFSIGCILCRVSFKVEFHYGNILEAFGNSCIQIHSKQGNLWHGIMLLITDGNMFSLQLDICDMI